MSIDLDGPLCACGNRGCLEALAGANAIVRRMKEAIEAGAPTPLASRSDELTPLDIYEAAAAGDAVARENIETTGRYLGVGVSNILHALNPEVVAFSGGVTAAGPMLLDPLKDEVDRRTIESCRRGVRIGYSSIARDAGLIGAARCFMLA
jgi:predicted NBD/HSP70 family sugar kinase